MEAQVLSPLQWGQLIASVILAVLALVYFIVYLRAVSMNKEGKNESLILLTMLLVAVMLFGAATRGGDWFWFRDIGNTRG